MRKANVGRADERIGVVGVDLAPEVAPSLCAPLPNLPRLLDRRLQSHLGHVVVARWDQLDALGTAVGVLKPLQPELDRRPRRLGVPRAAVAPRAHDIILDRLAVPHVVVALADLDTRLLVAVVDHGMHLLLLNRDVAQRLSHREHPLLALVGAGLAVGASLQACLLGGGFVEAVAAQHLGLEHGTC